MPHVTTPVKTEREQRRARRRAEMVQAAMDAVRAHGPGVSVAEIAAAAGITKPVLYRHFTDRADLQRAVGEQADDRPVAVAAPRLPRRAGADEPAERVDGQGVDPVDVRRDRDEDHAAVAERDVERAGGLTSQAYPAGVRFFRRLNDAGRVNLNLETALGEHDSRDNVILQPGDSVYVPEYIPTVRVTGAVNAPGSVLWKRGAGLGYYISAAGGYSQLADEGATPPLESLLIEESVEVVTALASELPPLWKAILVRRFGLNGDAPMTLAAIGEIHGLSRERVRQIEAKCLIRLRRKLEALGPRNQEAARSPREITTAAR